MRPGSYQIGGGYRGLKGGGRRADPVRVSPSRPAPDPPPHPFDRGFLREDERGATVFFPWGLGSRGYVLPDEAAKSTARRAVSLLFGAVIGLASWVGSVLAEAMRAEEADGALGAAALPLALLAAAFGLYVLWVWRFAERCTESDLRIPQEERFREAAQVTAPWKIVLIGAVLAVTSAVLAWLDPNTPAWLGLLGGATGIGLMLLGRAVKRAADSVTL